MALYNLDKRTISLFKGNCHSDAVRLALEILKDKPRCLIQHASIHAWTLEDGAELREKDESFYFTNDIELNIEAVMSSKSETVVFIDFDVYVLLHGFSKTLSLLRMLKYQKAVSITCSSDFPSLGQLETFSDVFYSIYETRNADVFDCCVHVLDKKGNITTSDNKVNFVTGRKPIFTVVRNASFVEENQKNPIDSVGEVKFVELPFFETRREDGVAVRDATKKKIRVGGKVVYEPDHDDDIDDSDPDDDLTL
ncbi:unnamed protein product [Caenorhabditis sp. 36 PRJEB53466]|nr:unnamed protein product [Caenorhabditis sp. 36 PRJEB53466]